MKIEKTTICLVTGASSGIGKAIAEKLTECGATVYGTSRKEASGAEYGYRMIKLDVCDAASVTAAVEKIIAAEKKIDVLINNAGAGIAGAVENTSLKNAQFQMDVNYMGALRMCKEVLPYMRKNGGGRIINIGSVAGGVTIPYQSVYSASKASLRVLTSAIRMETKQWGIETCIVEPGDTKTGFTDVRIKEKSAEDNPYAASYIRSVEKMEKDERKGMLPEKVAGVVLKVIKSRKMPTHKTVGIGYKAIVLLERLLPWRLSEFVIRKLYT